MNEENSLGTRISDVMANLTDSIPKRLDIVGLLRDAHESIIRAAAPDMLPPEVIIDKVTEVLREIASHAVGEFERRTGQQFLWVDEPEEPPEMLMSIGIEVKDGKGHVTF